MTVTGPRDVDHVSLPGKVKESFAKQYESSGWRNHWTNPVTLLKTSFCCLMISSFGCMISWHYHVHHSCDYRSWGMNPYILRKASYHCRSCFQNLWIWYILYRELIFIYDPEYMSYVYLYPHIYIHPHRYIYVHRWLKDDFTRSSEEDHPIWDLWFYEHSELEGENWYFPQFGLHLQSGLTLKLSDFQLSSFDSSERCCKCIIHTRRYSGFLQTEAHFH